MERNYSRAFRCLLGFQKQIQTDGPSEMSFETQNPIVRPIRQPLRFGTDKVLLICKLSESHVLVIAKGLKNLHLFSGIKGKYSGSQVLFIRRFWVGPPCRPNADPDIFTRMLKHLIQTARYHHVQIDEQTSALNIMQLRNVERQFWPDPRTLPLFLCQSDVRYRQCLHTINQSGTIICQTDKPELSRNGFATSVEKNVDIVGWKNRSPFHAKNSSVFLCHRLNLPKKLVTSSFHFLIVMLSTCPEACSCRLTLMPDRVALHGAKRN